MSVIVAIAQINSTVGDLAGNSERIAAAARRAADQGVDILLTPELSLVGYPPEDLLLRRSFYAKSAAALAALAAELAGLKGLHVIVGHPLTEAEGDGNGAGDFVNYNAASVLKEGEIIATYRKHALPNYTVFDEKRYFTPSDDACTFDVKGTRFAINICEDTWFPDMPAKAKAAGAQVLLVPNASPYHMNKEHLRIEVMRENVCRRGMALVYANLYGAQDELVFDGASFVLDADGELRAQLKHFGEDFALVRFDGGVPQPQPLPEPLSLEAQVYEALVTGVRDYVTKNGFPGAIIGLSGGVDSALTLAIAVDALGAHKVRAVKPGRSIWTFRSIRCAQKFRVPCSCPSCSTVAHRSHHRRTPRRCNPRSTCCGRRVGPCSSRDAAHKVPGLYWLACCRALARHIWIPERVVVWSPMNTPVWWLPCVVPSWDKPIWW